LECWTDINSVPLSILAFIILAFTIEMKLHYTLGINFLVKFTYIILGVVDYVPTKY